MDTVLLVHKDGNLEETIVKTNLFTTCNYRNDNQFELLATYSELYELYGKRKGKTGTENKFVFPDQETYFGNLCIVKKGGSITIDEWKNYENSLNEVDLNDNELLPEEYESE